MRPEPEAVRALRSSGDAGAALLAALVDPALGGVLLRGAGGTGKTLLARAAAALHTSPGGDHPFVVLPLGATEDNLLGAPDFSALLAGRGYHRRSGLLERANGRILLIDDIGLVPDHIMDMVMEACGSGTTGVEREGVSLLIPSRFLAFATSGDTSGRLPPRIVDRFALSATTLVPSDREARSALLMEALSGGCGDFGEDAVVAGREFVARARRRLPLVKVPSWLFPSAALTASRLRLDGHRGEVAACRASIALSALAGRRRVDEGDFELAVVLTMSHRTCMQGSVSPPGRTELAALARDCRRMVEKGLAAEMADMDAMAEKLLSGVREAMRTSLAARAGGAAPTAGLLSPVPFGRFPVSAGRRQLGELLRLASRAKGGKAPGGPVPARTEPASGGRGRKIRMVRAAGPGDCEIHPSARAALLAGRRPPLFPLEEEHLRRWERAARPVVTAMLVVDASMSSQAYLHGLGDVLAVLFDRFLDPQSRVGLVSISDGAVELAFQPTRNRKRVFGRIAGLAPGGCSPLGSALVTAEREIVRARMHSTAGSCMVILVSDCYPEPVPAGAGDIYESAPYREVKQAARSLGMKKIPVVILDPVNVPRDLAESLPGRRLARFVARASTGVHICLPAEKVRPSGFSVAQVLEAGHARSRRLAEQIANQLEAHRRQQPSGALPAPLG